MLVRCPSCRSAYRLDAARVPESGVRVRCPRCAHVFRLRATPESEPRAATPADPPVVAPPSAGWSEALPGLERDLREPPRLPSRPAAGVRGAEASERPAVPERRMWNPGTERTLQLDASQTEAGPPPRLETPPFRPGQKQSPAAAPSATASPTPRGAAAPVEAAATPSADPEVRRAHERARRLARVLVSDILVYNQETRDRALREGNLMAALGVEINKAWELYKSKVSPEVVGTTTYFKDALNEILAEGDKIF